MDIECKVVRLRSETDVEVLLTRKFRAADGYDRTLRRYSILRMPSDRIEFLSDGMKWKSDSQWIESCGTLHFSCKHSVKQGTRTLIVLNGEEMPEEPNPLDNPVEIDLLDSHDDPNPLDNPEEPNNIQPPTWHSGYAPSHSEIQKLVAIRKIHPKYEKVRTWVSKDGGKKLLGLLSHCDSTHAYIVSGGKKLRIKLANLSERDRKFLALASTGK